MDLKFDNDSGNSQQDAPVEKKNQSALMIVLLILVGGFMYLYFFTGLIKPQETLKVAEAPPPAPQAVKMPLPAREAGSSTPEKKAPEKIEAPKTVVVPAAPAPASAPKTAVPPPAATTPAPKPVIATVQPAPTPVAKPTPTPAKPKEEPKKVEETKPTDKKPLPERVADKNGGKSAAVKAKTKKAAADGPVKANSKTADSFSLVVGNYVLAEALSADMGRVRKAGFEPLVKPSDRKKTTMNRLFVSDYSDRASAQSALEKLKRHTSDGFIIEHDGKYSVYAGSYLQNEAANSEIERLKAAGFTATVKHVDIAIPSQSLSVGPFKNKKEADSALVTLKNAGIKAIFSQK
jgi:cell division septation protein DedD